MSTDTSCKHAHTQTHTFLQTSWSCQARQKVLVRVCVCKKERELIMGMVEVILPLYINSALPNTQTMAENAILLPITKSLFILSLSLSRIHALRYVTHTQIGTRTRIHTHARKYAHTLTHTLPLIILYFVFQSAGSSGDNKYFFHLFLICVWASALRVRKLVRKKKQTIIFSPLKLTILSTHE